MSTANNYGVLCASFNGVRKAPEFDGQMYDPRSYVWDTELNEWVSFYWTDERFYSDAYGAQCIWLENGASCEEEEEFGIKLTTRSVREHSTAKAAAYAMYQRQKLAADHGLAPPVHGMCCMKQHDKKNGRIITYWGYLSSVACVDENPEYSDEAMAAWQELVDAWEAKSNALDEVESALDGLDLSCRQVQGIMDTIRDEVMQDTIDPDCLDMDEWMRDRAEDGHFELYDGLRDLQEELENLSIGGLQNEFLSFGNLFEDYVTMGGDLHGANIGYWKGRLVAIDFGHHCVCGY